MSGPILFVVVVVAVVVFSSPLAANTAISWEQMVAAQTSHFSVSDLAERAEFGVPTITGTITNNSIRSYRYVQVEISLYDETGAMVGSTMAEVNNLSPNGRWSFSAPVLGDEKAVSFKVHEITGF